MKNLRPIAIYLPQFHPIPENDKWWGKGFTEWTNVTRAKPLFQGHYQPHLPADLGFYDLRVSEVREAQAKMAKQHGIYGFCYYHYWFNGKRLLERPFLEVFESGKPDFPFMLCWANENWTRSWDGGTGQVIQKQQYSDEDHIRHIHTLIEFFKDRRYIRVGDKPVFAIFKSDDIPNIQNMLQLWRLEAKKSGIDLYLVRFESHGKNGKAYMVEGFDAAVEFQPHLVMSSKLPGLKTLRDEINFATILRSAKYRMLTLISKMSGRRKQGVIKYQDLVTKDIALYKQRENAYKLYPSVCVGFDNTPRRKDGYLVLENSTPELLGKWLNAKVEHFKPYSEEENMFFINAWNEWAEGNHLEPCLKWGKNYLEAVKHAFE